MDDPLRAERDDLRRVTLDLMRSLMNGILTDEALAGEVTRLADSGLAIGVEGGTDGLRAIARHHRIRALEGRARLASIAEDHARLDPD